MHLPISVLVRTYRTSFEVNETRVVKVEKNLKGFYSYSNQVGEGLNFLFRYSIFFLGNIFNALYLDVTCDPVVARISVLENPGIHHST